VKQYNLDYLKEMSGGDAAFMDEMIGYFLENSPSVITRLDQCLQSGDWEGFRFAIHKFAPNLAIVGLNSLAEMASRLEQLSGVSGDHGLIPATYDGFRERLSSALDEMNLDFSHLLKPKS